MAATAGRPEGGGEELVKEFIAAAEAARHVQARARDFFDQQKKGRGSAGPSLSPRYRRGGEGGGGGRKIRARNEVRYGGTAGAAIRQSARRATAPPLHRFGGIPARLHATASQREAATLARASD